MSFNHYYQSELTALRPVGFAEDEALIPYPLNTFRSYRYLLEYFAFQDKFLFVDGLDLLGGLPEEVLKQIRGLELRFDIRKSGIQRLHPTLENVKLYCTPVANLFRHDAFNRSLVDAVRNHPKIGKVLIIDLKDKGDPIYAGIRDQEIVDSAAMLGQQMLRAKDISTTPARMPKDRSGTGNSRDACTARGFVEMHVFATLSALVMLWLSVTDPRSTWIIQAPFSGWSFDLHYVLFVFCLATFIPLLLIVALSLLQATRLMVGGKSRSVGLGSLGLACFYGLALYRFNGWFVHEVF
ncbi:type VI secretion protein, family [Pseudomonas aeruginosa]|nr:hypothetical protein AN455_06355 [Pseudomonas aeruginosa]KRU97974.1 hypothetical protein AN456_06165 [Pseudomonas aeruginosa]RCM98190.1 type VI secretion protein, family [Pseudomonas aeruginosa]SQC53088.1 type VI secretion protein [Pseudomonas aeruginosa]